MNRYRSLLYKLSYNDYWSSKGDYGKIRIARVIARKQKRWDSLHHRTRHWVCDMNYSDCNARGFCNGDC